MRLLMITNQTSPEGHAGFRETYERMGGIGASVRFVTPTATAFTQGHDASLAELMKAGQEDRRDVILVASPSTFSHDRGWVDRFLRCAGNPVVLYYEGDSWHRWAKPINASMGAWLTAADTVFAVAREPRTAFLRRRGAKQVRFIPDTYCHVIFANAETTDPLDNAAVCVDALVIGGGRARWGHVSRVPGAVQRARLVRRLQRQRDVSLALYGAGWSGRGARGILPYRDQATAIRHGLVAVNWDHFPNHESYASDRLPISLLAGRAHLTAAHPKCDWLPAEQA